MSASLQLFALTCSVLWALLACFAAWVSTECYRTRNDPPHDGGSTFFGCLAVLVVVVAGAFAFWGFSALLSLR